MLTPDQITLIKQSWKNFRGLDPVLVGDVFYSKLFLDYPQVQHLFHTARAEQSKKLVDMLNVIVCRMDQLDRLRPDIQKLGERHAQYGARPHHYRAVGQTLLWTLEQGLGAEWTPALKEAWQRCFETLAQAMQVAPVEK